MGNGSTVLIAQRPRTADHVSLRMDPRKLLYFATVVEQGSLAKAAKALSISQPALSKSMDRLEADLKMKLLTRGAGGITTTLIGELVYSHARLIKDEITVVENRLRSQKARQRVLTIGTLPSLASTVMPLAVGRWRERNPDVLLRVVERIQVELLLDLLRSEFDFIIGQTEYYDISLDGLKQRVLFRDHLCVFARPDHPLFSSPDPSWADLASFPWVLPMVAGPQRTVLERILASEGVQLPEQLIESGSIDFTRTLVTTSNHLAMLPAHSVMVDIREGAIKALPIAVPALKRDIAVIFRQRSPLDSVSRGLITHIEALGTELSTLPSFQGSAQA